MRVVLVDRDVAVPSLWLLTLPTDGVGYGKWAGKDFLFPMMVSIEAQRGQSFLYRVVEEVLKEVEGAAAWSRVL